MDVTPPEPGTEEFAHFVIEHFKSLSDALRDFVGKEAFGEYCTFITGVKITKPDIGVLSFPIGNVKGSIRLISQTANIAAIETAKRNNITIEEAYANVLHELQQDMMGVRPDKIITLE